MAVRISSRALDELVDILWWYDLNAGAPVAAMMEDRFWQTFIRIGEPLPPGVRRLSWLPDPYRFVLMDPYWIIWRPAADGRVIIAILHARRDVARLLIDLE